MFPHIYGPINRDSILDIVPLNKILNQINKIQNLIKHFEFDRLPLEGIFFKSTFRSDEEDQNKKPLGTGMIGMFCNDPYSASFFHRLTIDEMWHYYGGDLLELILLYPNGHSENIIMGHDVLNGQYVQYIVPAGVWQAGRVAKNSRYALFGCTMSPGFTSDCFEAGIEIDLIKKYPGREADIRDLSIKGHETRMPKNFAN